MPAVIPIACLLLPASKPATFAPVCLQREIAALQTIEALRMAAASNNGQFPPSLEQLPQCPAPLDPATGKFIDYQSKDGTAILTLPPPEGRSAQQGGKRYELRLRQPSESDEQPKEYSMNLLSRLTCVTGTIAVLAATCLNTTANDSPFTAIAPFVDNQAFAIGRLDVQQLPLGDLKPRILEFLGQVTGDPAIPAKMPNAC